MLIQINQKINDWTVKSDIYRIPYKGQKAKFVECECICGFKKQIPFRDLIKNKTRCCKVCSSKKNKSGKINIKKAIEKKITHGFCRNGKIKEYHIWNSIKNRCYNPNNKGFINYGARGITLCDEWKNDFKKFIEDMGKQPFQRASIERLDNDKGYFKENCIWTTSKIQANNKRNTFKLNGKNISITDESKKINKCRFFVSKKLKEGFSLFEIKQMESLPYKEYNFKRNFSWSLRYEKCIKCNSNKKNYMGKGMCTRCYQKAR